MFKNAHLYRLKEPERLDPDTIERSLAQQAFRPCGPLESVRLGWVPPLGDETRALMHRQGNRVLLCARRQERLLPASVIKELLEERIQDIEHRESRRVGSRERRQLREEILLRLLPNAFTHSRYIHLYLDLERAWLLVDAASAGIAEEAINLLRLSLGSLPVHPPHPTESPAHPMTRWVADGVAPNGLELGDECELRDPRDERAVVRCRGQDLGGPEIAAHLKAGKQVVKLALSFPDRLSWILQEDLSLRRLRFADALLDSAREDGIEDEAAQRDAEFLLMSQELRELLDTLEACFGLDAAR